MKYARSALLLTLLAATPVLAQQKQPETPEQTEPAADLAFGAFQRGEYLTAYTEATRRIEATKDPKAMTLVAELLANGLGVKRDEARAVHWYKLAAEAGDRAAIYALGIHYLEGRGAPQNSVDACAWHTLARARSVSDPDLDRVCDTLAPKSKEALTKRLQHWLKGPGEDRS